MRWIFLAALFFTFTVAPLAKADPFDAQRVPADAKWVVHVDMDAARASKTWEAIDQRIMANKQWLDNLDQVEAITGLRLPDDLHDVTVYGRSAEEEAGVLVIHAQLDRDRIMTALEANPDFGSTPYGKYEILTWDDNGKKQFGAFHTDGVVILGRSSENIEAAIDTLDAKAEAIKADGPLAAGAKPQVLLYVAGKELSELKKEGKAQSPIVRQIDSAWIALTEKGDKVNLKANVVAKTPESAKQMLKALDGIKAMVSLAGDSENSDPNLKLLSTILPDLTSNLQDKTVSIDLPVSVDVVRGFIEKLNLGGKADAKTDGAAPKEAK